MAIQVFDKDEFGNDELEGVLMIDISEYDHQEPIEVTLQLTKEDYVTLERGRLKLKIHLIWSKSEYFRKKLEKTENGIKELTQLLKEINTLMECFTKPFGLIIMGELNAVSEGRIITRECIEEKGIKRPSKAIENTTSIKKANATQKLNNMISGALSSKLIQSMMLSGLMLLRF